MKKGDLILERIPNTDLVKVIEIMTLQDVPRLLEMTNFNLTGLKGHVSYYDKNGTPCEKIKETVSLVEKNVKIIEDFIGGIVDDEDESIVAK